ncbi:MAG: hypothetical protein DLM53_09600 [Candidatus Eremiobacter antarcticus]|nr:MAG: hypothetical protein DLM53_09600 [Candidatus Eremiobacter sp. RRmetagenome_bin22]
MRAGGSLKTKSIMIKDFRFQQVDVFTKQVFAGNPLAVFTDGEGLSTSQMQSIASEMNLSETTFVTPSTDARCSARVRIFTPRMELPFAGHPTVGTGYVLACAGRLRPDSSGIAYLEENVGPVPLRIEGPADKPDALFLTAPPIDFGDTFEERAAIASSLNVSEPDLVPNAPIQIAGCPPPFLYVALQDPAKVDEVKLNEVALLKAIGNQRPPEGVFAFAPSGKPNGFYSRMLGLEHVGVVEDPATGSASAPLGAYLAYYGLVSGEGRISMLSEQGTKMGRQSFISVIVEKEGKTAKRVEVGGSVVPVLSGLLPLEVPTKAAA